MERAIDKFDDYDLNGRRLKVRKVVKIAISMVYVFFLHYEGLTCINNFDSFCPDFIRNYELIKVSLRYTRRRSGVAGGPAAAASLGRGPAAAGSPARAASLAAAARVLKIARIGLAPSLAVAAAAPRIARIGLGPSLAAARSAPRTGPSHDQPSVPSPALGPANDPAQDQSHAM